MAGDVEEDLDVEEEVGGGCLSCGIGGHGFSPHDAVDACTNITNSYYTTDQYSMFSAA